MSVISLGGENEMDIAQWDYKLNEGRNHICLYTTLSSVSKTMPNTLKTCKMLHSLISITFRWELVFWLQDKDLHLKVHDMR